jgi:leader peptidase (prepilin peptidase)/N-methyltransferase
MILCIFFALCGLLMGSFLNVCIVRLPAGESIMWPRSHCRHCKQPIANRDNIPLLSYLLLGAACRACGSRIPWRYPAIEFTTCVLFVMCCLNFSPGWLAGCWALLCFFLLGLAVMDAETLLLPDLFTLPGLLAGVVFAALRPGLERPGWAWGTALRAAGLSLVAAAAAAAALLLIAGVYWLLRRRMGMGLGDVKLLAMLAAWLGLRQTGLVLFLRVSGSPIRAGNDPCESQTGHPTGAVAGSLWDHAEPRRAVQHFSRRADAGLVPAIFPLVWDRRS